MQAEAYDVFRTRDSLSPLDHSSHRFVPFWRCILPINLCTIQVDFWCCTSYLSWVNNILQTIASLYFLIWFTRNFNFWQWTCYTADAFTSVMNAYHVNHITSPTHYPQSNGLAEKYVQMWKAYLQAKEEEKDLLKCLMIWHNTPLSSSLQLPMQILQSRCVRSDLPCLL